MLHQGLPVLIQLFSERSHYGLFPSNKIQVSCKHSSWIVCGHAQAWQVSLTQKMHRQEALHSVFPWVCTTRRVTDTSKLEEQ